ncbi:DNA-directed RNA polymerase subunit delta [Tenericutes bacterium MZ-XQ]|jgi:DNA-directed RNA polymerase subunit delta|nr:DNA-directed RNA polymerase subunit delta [Tenericutes bacterium MZ-XQ]
MNDKFKSMSMIDIVEHLLKENSEPISIHDIIKQIKEIKNVSDDDVDRLTQLYMDITQSAKFVYVGDDKWDLKERNLEMWDKDGYAFVTPDEVEEDVEEDLDFTEFDIEDLEEQEKDVDDDDEDEEEEEDEEIKEEKEYIDVELPIKSTDEDDVDDDVDLEFDDDYDEDDYNEIMDDYEDMYDED